MSVNPHLATPSGHPRARALSVPFDGVPGLLNAITDVPGVAVGYTTLISGDGPLVVGQGPIRTGVTAILPRGADSARVPVFAGYHSLNGAGEMTGSHWMDEVGLCEGPITITNTHSVGVARDASVKWTVAHASDRLKSWYVPVAAETYDGYLNDTNGFHVHEEHVLAAIESAKAGSIEEGSVGGGTGMIAYEFKGGSGTSSRAVKVAGREFTVGVFVQANFGLRNDLLVAGVPVGRAIPDGAFRKSDTGSIITVVATDAPLLPHQLKRLARRVSLGVARTGSYSGHGSGDLFMSFSTANRDALDRVPGDASINEATFLPDPSLDPIFTAVVRATEEAIVNSMVANETMTGRDGHTVVALRHNTLQNVLRRHGRLVG